MSYFNVTILGCGSATPTLRHNPSAQLVTYRRHNMLVDCGEGTQLQLRRYGISFARIDHIFLSHLHGDHFLGLPGLLSTMALHSVEGDVTVHTFAEGVDILRPLINAVCRERTYTLHWDVVEPGTTSAVFDDGSLRVTAFPLYHRVPCVGYRFDEVNKRRHIDRESCDYYGVPNFLMNEIKDGADLVLPDGVVVPNERLTTDPTPPASYAYCSDTAMDMRVAEAVKGVEVLYHESTYGDDGLHKAAPRGHSTARQAGEIARAAGAGTLVLGHYSKTIFDEARLAVEAAEVFDGKVIAGNEGIKIDLA